MASRRVRPGVKAESIDTPPRFAPLTWKAVCAMAGGFALVVHSFFGTELNDLRYGDIVEIPANVFRLLGEMFPPDLGNLDAVGAAVVETLQMSLVGTVLGVLFSFPLAYLAAKPLSPHRVSYYAARSFIAFCRTVPDLVWAIFFVIIVGLGPLAGMLTLLVDTIGFAGRFFAEAFEEVDQGPQEALSAIGASRTDNFFSTILPASMPSCVNTSMFSLERAVQSSVILGLVGAGGIGMLLEEPMTWHNYSEATTVVVTIFLILVIVEQVSARVRQRILI